MYTCTLKYLLVINMDILTMQSVGLHENSAWKS